jgi:arsenate reductase-like glutaredoxin family protein
VIRFKEFAEQVQWQQSLSRRLFDVGQGASIGFNAFWLPMSSSIMKRIWPKEVRATVFHVTDESGYKQIKKMQGKKSAISAFFEMRSNYFAQGIQTSGGVVIELDANILGAFNQDVMSAPDPSGRRWIQLEYMKGRFGEKDLSKYSKGLQDLIGGLLQKYLPIVMKHTGKSPPKTMQKGKYFIHWMNLGRYAAQEPGKKTILSRIIKEYMDGVEDIFKKNATHLRGLLTNYLNLRRTEEAWDEILANNFQIKKVWVVGIFDQKRVGEFKDEVGDKYEIEEISQQELEQYTRAVAKKEAGDASKKSNPADDLAKRQAEVLKAIGKK